MSERESVIPGYELGPKVAYRGKVGCQSVICTRRPDWPDRCYGWHCPICHEPTSYQGHWPCPHDPLEQAALAEQEKEQG